MAGRSSVRGTWTTRAVLVVAALGCGAPTPPPVPSPPAATATDDDAPTIATLNGYRFELPTVPRAATNPKRAWVNEVVPEGVRCRNDILATTLEVRDGRLWRNGRDLGPVAPGDQIVLDAQGALTINGRATETPAPSEPAPVP